MDDKDNYPTAGADNNAYGVGVTVSTNKIAVAYQDAEGKTTVEILDLHSWTLSPEYSFQIEGHIKAMAFLPLLSFE